MSNVRLSLPLRWSALPAANLTDQVLGIMRSLVLGGGKAGGSKNSSFTVIAAIVITVISSHMHRKQYNVVKLQKRKKTFIISMISCNQDT